MHATLVPTDSAPRLAACPRLPGWVLALALSLLAHGAWIAATAPAPEPLRVQPLLIRLQAQPAPAPAPSPAPAPQRPAREAAQASPAEKPTASAGPLAVTPQAPVERLQAPADAVAAQLPAREFDEPQIPDARRWRYRLQMPGGTGVAELFWQHDGRRFLLTLERQLEGRALPGWRSEGQIHAGGLQPLHFEVWRRGRLREAIRFEPEAGRAHFSALRGTQEVVPFTQDRLSWIVQLAAQVNGQSRRRGEASFTVSMVGWRGGLFEYNFSVPPTEEAEPLPDGPDLLQLRGRHPDDLRFQIDVWLDPAQGYLPRRMVQRFDGEPRSEWTLLEAQPPELPGSAAATSGANAPAP